MRSSGTRCSRSACAAGSAPCPCRPGGSGPPTDARSPAIIRSEVVFPQPDGPSSEKNSPEGMSRLIPATAVKSPKRFTRSTSRTSPPAIVARSVAHARHLGSSVRSASRRPWHDAPMDELGPHLRPGEIARQVNASDRPSHRAAPGRLLVVRPVLGRLGDPRLEFQGPHGIGTPLWAVSTRCCRWWRSG